MSSLPLPIAAFVAGLISFLSPCVLPLVPGYVSLISGSTLEEMQSRDSKLFATVMLKSLMFIFGFTVVFVSLGAVATTLGQLTAQYRKPLTQVAGLIIILFGLHLAGIFKIKWLYADKRLRAGASGNHSVLGAFLVGFAFAFGWTPCIGPILATILAFAASQATVIKGMLLLTVYSLGMAVPFLLTSVGIDRFLVFYGRFRRHLHLLEVASGVLLVLIGALVLTRKFTLLSSYLTFLNRFAL